MLARLWWKEYRAFGPVWLVLALAAAGAQWLLLTLSREEFRSGALTLVALGWVVLYAFTAGAAAFAGEREAKTLSFLDALPVDRGVLWLGKVSFTLASTFGLALAFAGLAAVGTEVRTDHGSYQYGSIIRVFGVLLFEAAAWSLFWSSATRNPLLAGILAVVGLAISSSVIESATATVRYRAVDFDLVSTGALPFRLLFALLVLLASGPVMAWRPGARRPVPVRRPAAEPRAVALTGSSAHRSLAWLALREGRTTWLVAAALALFVSTGWGWYPSGDPITMLVILAVLTCLVAGVGVFGTADAPGSRRFLASHGVGPAGAWWRKVLTTGGVLGALFGASLYSDWTGPSVPLSFTGRDQEYHERAIMLLGLALLDAFAVGLVCGMAITRRVTAVTLGAVGVIAIVPFSILLVDARMVPLWSVFLVPAALVAASRAWAADWMFEREGARPWIKLGAWIVVPFLLLGGWYVSYRAYGVPDVGPRYAAADLVVPTPPPGQDAAALYGEASAVIRPPNGPLGDFAQRVDDAIRRGWDGTPADVVAWWKSNAAALGLARRASTPPIARFEGFERSVAGSTPDPALENARLLSDLLGLDARERLARGDLAGAWDDALALLRMANQFAGNAPTLAMINQATTFHHRGIGLAFATLDDPRVTLEFANKALADLKAMPGLPGLAGAVKVEAAIIDRWLDLPGQDLASLVLGPNQTSVAEALRFARIEANPWERERARRVCRKIIEKDLYAVAVDPSARTALSSGQPTDGALSRLAGMLLPNFGASQYGLDRETVGRRALVQVAALRSWKLAHDGKDAEALQLLVPGLLPALPLDPYSGGPFGYIRSEGQAVVAPIEPDNASLDVSRETRPGQYLLYSVGPDRTDNGASRIFQYVNQPTGDFTYAVP